MDPYIERSDIWPDFHDHFVTVLKSFLQPLLRPRYVAMLQNRLYVVNDDQTRKPDVSIVRSAHRQPRESGTSLLDVDTPAIFELYREEVREPLIEIIELGDGNKVVTAIEVLSPGNKQSGPGRTSYLTKRDQYAALGVNMIEIDLLASGLPTIALRPDKLESLRPWRYLVAVSRYTELLEVYPVPLDHRLPKIAVPLAYDDRDVPLDLQAAFTRSWEEGPYPELLQYDGPPPAHLDADEQSWCRQRLAAASFISA